MGPVFGGAVAVDQAATSRMNTVVGMPSDENMPPNMPPKTISYPAKAGRPRRAVVLILVGGVAIWMRYLAILHRSQPPFLAPVDMVDGDGVPMD